MNSDEFKTCVMPHSRMMYAKAVTLLRNADDAADVVQEALANLWQNRQRLKSIDNMASYCSMTARNIALDRLKRQSMTLSIDVDRIQLMMADVDSAGRIDARGELKEVIRLMSHLPESQRQVLMLNAFNGCSNDEIARVTGFTIANVRQLLSRGRQRLRAMYANRS